MQHFNFFRKHFFFFLEFFTQALLVPFQVQHNKGIGERLCKIVVFLTPYDSRHFTPLLSAPIGKRYTHLYLYTMLGITLYELVLSIRLGMIVGGRGSAMRRA